MNMLLRTHVIRRVQNASAILLCILFFFAGVSLANAAEGRNPGARQRHGRIKRDLTPEQRKELRERNKAWQKELRELKREGGDDADRYVILRHMLRNYATMEEDESPEARSLRQEWDALLSNHPEFLKNPPRRTRKQHQVRKAQRDEDEDIRTKAQTFEPKDAQVLSLYGSGREALAQYQYRLEFFRLPADVTWAGTPYPLKLMRDGKEVSLSELKPHKTMRFRDRIRVYPGFGPGLTHAIDRPIWVCVDHTLGYTPNSLEEFKILRHKGHGVSGMPWRNPKGMLDDLCGAVSLDGKIVYELPIAQKPPNTLLRVLEASNDGKRAVLIIGDRATDGADDAMVVAHPRKILVWESPKTLREFAADDPSQEAQEVRERHINLFR